MFFFVNIYMYKYISMMYNVRINIGLLKMFTKKMKLMVKVFFYVHEVMLILAFRFVGLL